MRVNVTYSVELDEVSAIVTKLLEGAAKELDSLVKEFPKVSTAVNTENEKKALNSIDNCRKLLSKIDHSLFDCESILSGYQQTLVQLHNQEKENMGGVIDDVPEDG